jgi:hypothetical protein
MVTAAARFGTGRLVYSLTEKAKEEKVGLLRRPIFWGMAALVILVVLQIIFW